MIEDELLITGLHTNGLELVLELIVRDEAGNDSAAQHGFDRG
jgi:hypothetical protein